MVVEVPTRDSPKRTFAVAIAAAFAMLAKRASRLPLKLKAAAAEPLAASRDDWKIELRSPAATPKSQLARPKKLLSNLGSKTLSFIQRKKGDKEEGDWGDGGVWQKAILMGDKCEPLDFPGVIYYDSNGKQVNEIPSRSPRASPVPTAYFIRQRQQQLKL